MLEQVPDVNGAIGAAGGDGAADEGDVASFVRVAHEEAGGGEVGEREAPDELLAGSHHETVAVEGQGGDCGGEGLLLRADAHAQVPHAHRAVCAPADDLCVVELQRRNVRAVPLQLPMAGARPHVPHPQRAVLAARGEAVVEELEVVDGALVAEEGGDALAGGDVPDLDGAVVAASDCLGVVRLEAVDGRGVADELEQTLSPCGVPHAHTVVGAARQHPPAASRRHAPHCAVVRHQRVPALAARQVPHAHRLVCAAARQAAVGPRQRRRQRRALVAVERTR
mmetsp:Transcript_8678/g.36160  ORF Transcript_8678/g.36160 Transcript_8678/m.36160 type:complete len:281 (+) Transcript_8678:24-866(+)